ncbi:hypothetical protein N9V96_01535 [Polaribacter sp.]|nr:hypothetical protein [Polaribacter sp.]
MKGNNFSKILNILIAVIAIVGAVLFIRIFMADGDALQEDVDLQNSLISPIIYFSTILFIAAVAIAILLSLWTLVRNPENLKKMLLSLAVLGVFLIIAYSLSDNSVAVLDNNGMVLEGGEAGSSTNKWVGTGIMYSLILGAIAGIGFVVDLVRGLIK